MCTTQISFLPSVDRRNRKFVIMDIGKYLFVGPICQWAESCNSSGVCICIGSSSNIIPVCPSPSKQNHIQVVFPEILFLCSVLYYLKPCGCCLCILWEKHFRMWFQPFNILPCINNGKPFRCILLRPRLKCWIFKIAYRKNTFLDTGLLANLTKYNTVLSRAPSIGNVLTIRLFLNVLDGLSHFWIQILFWDRLLDVCHSFNPRIITDSLLSSQCFISHFVSHLLFFGYVIQ